MTTPSTGTSDSVSPPAHSSRPPSATARQPWRSASRPASGPAAPMTHSTNTSPMSAGESEKGGRSRRKSMYEKTPMKEKKRPAPVRHVATSPRLASSRRKVATDRPADGGPGVSGGSERRITSVAASGSVATAPSATRQLVAAVSRATPTRPTSPPTTRAETYMPMAREPIRSWKASVT